MIFKNKIFYFFIFLTGILAFLSAWASSSPDGLERVAQRFGFEGRAQNIFGSWLAGYLVPGVKNEKLAGWLAAAGGILIVFFLVQILRIFLAGKFIKRRNSW